MVISASLSATSQLLVVLAEESLPELVGADHDGARWGHFDDPRQETWKAEDHMEISP